MNLLGFFSALFISFAGWMFNSLQDNEVRDNDTAMIQAQVLKISVEQKNIKVRDGVFEVRGIIVNLSEKDTIKYHTWIGITYYDKTTGETKNISQTISESRKIFGNIIPPLGEDSFKISTESMVSSGSATRLSGEGIVSIYATPTIFPQPEDRISNLLKIKVNFDTNTVSILED